MEQDSKDANVMLTIRPPASGGGPRQPQDGSRMSASPFSGAAGAPASPKRYPEGAAATSMLRKLSSKVGADDGWLEGAPSPRTMQALQTPRRRQHGDHEDASSIYPVPRFPPAHTSAAFEAVAVRKSLILTPPEIYAECAHHGEEKANLGWLKFLMLSIIAGCYVGFGFSLCLLIGGNIGMDIYHDRPGLFNLVFGAVGFPTGFFFIVICGGELFTSLCAYMSASWWEGRTSFRTCMRVWVVSWIGNFAGTAIFLGLMLAAGSFEGSKGEFAKVLAGKKTHHPWGSDFVLGIFCNWLVCIATWQANAAQDMMGKFIAVWLPISAFVMMGFEHIIANQYLLPLSVALGSGLSAYDIIVMNLIPTTLGNWVGGFFFVGTVYAFAYGKPNKDATEWWDRMMAARSEQKYRGKRAVEGALKENGMGQV